LKIFLFKVSSLFSELVLKFAEAAALMEEIQDVLGKLTNMVGVKGLLPEHQQCQLSFLRWLLRIINYIFLSIEVAQATFKYEDQSFVVFV
jgi:hypothetical protein